MLLLLLVTGAGAAEADEHQVQVSDDLRVLFGTDDVRELQLAAASLWQGEAETQMREEHVYVLVLDCVRALVERQVGGLAGTRVAAEILAPLNFNTPLAAAAQLQRCQAYRRDTAREQVARHAQARFITAYTSAHGDRVRTLLYRFVKPTTTCYSVAGRLGLGLVAAFGGDIAVEYCYANNGRHWLQTALEAEAGYGAGALFTWRWGNYRYRMNYLGGPFTYTKSRHRDWALGFGMSRAEYGEEYAHQQRGIIIALPSRHNHSLRAGLGAAYLRTWGRRIGLKFLPLGTRDERLLAEYVALARRDLLLGQGEVTAGLRGEEELRLQAEYVQRDDERVARFRLCSVASSVCEDLLGGRYFPLALIESNRKRLHDEEHTLREEAAGQRTSLLAAAIVATATSAPATLKHAVGRFSRTAVIPPSRWDGFDFDTHLVNEGGRGIREGSGGRKIWRARRGLLQKIFDSRPVGILGETASKIVEAWNGLFVKLGRTRLLSRTLRTGIPAVVILGSGAVVLLSSLKLAEQEIVLEKLAEISTQQEEVFQLLQNPYREVLVHDRTLLLQSLRYLVSRP